MKKFVISSLLAVASCIATVGISHADTNPANHDKNQASQIDDGKGHGHKNGRKNAKHKRGMKKGKGILSKLNLTEDQKSKIKAINKTRREKRKSEKSANKIERKQMREQAKQLMNNSQLDGTLLNNLANQKAEKSKINFIEKIKHQHAIAQVLTPEQRAKMKEIRANQKKNRKGKR